MRVSVALACRMPRVELPFTVQQSRVSGDVARMLLGSCCFTDGAVNALAGEHMPWKWAEHDVTTEDGFTALHVAAKFGHVSVAKALLEAGRFRCVNAATSQARYTALHVAARYGHAGVAETLLQKGGRFDAVNALDLDGASTALHVSAIHGSTDVAKSLLASQSFTGAAQRTEREQLTALHDAAFYGQLEVLQLLLTSNRFPRESVNATNRWGGTALHTACLCRPLQYCESIA